MCLEHGPVGPLDVIGPESGIRSKWHRRHPIRVNAELIDQCLSRELRNRANVVGSTRRIV